MDRQVDRREVQVARPEKTAAAAAAAVDVLGER